MKRRIGFCWGSQVVWVVQVATMSLGLMASTAVWAETVQLGKVEFIADTNIKMFKFTGEAKNLTSKVERTGNALTALEVRIPVNSLKTGMEIRDKHMRERIFTATDGSTPDIVFKAERSRCKAGASASDQVCDVDGLLTIRGEQRPYKLTFQFKDFAAIETSAMIDVLQFGVKPEVLQYSEIKVSPNVTLNIKVKLQ